MATANQKTEKHLNETYASCYGEEEAVEAFEYITVRGRCGGSTTENNIRHHYRNHMLGTLLRRYDRTAFECIKSDKNFK